MKISIIIPIYNVSQYIERCLISALDQTYDDIEYILVNDASPDNSLSIVENLLKTHSRKECVKIINHSTNKGLSAARNTGVKEASGDYIYFMDSDDAIPPECIQILTALTQHTSLDLVLGEIKVFGNKRKAYPLLLIEDGIYYGNDFIMNSFLKKQWYEMAWNKLIKRTLFFEKNLWFCEGILHEDILWSFHMASVINSMGVIHAETYYYYIQSNSITQKKSEKNIDSLYFILSEIINTIDKQKLSEKYKDLSFYLNSLKKYFLRSLAKSKLEEKYTSIQKEKINNLYNSQSWIKRKESIIIKLRNSILHLFQR